MQPRGNRPLEIRNSPPPGILPGKFLKYESFFIYIALSVSFEGYSANCALIYTIQLSKCGDIVTKCAFLTVYFPKKTSAPQPVLCPRIPLGTVSPRPLHCALPGKLWDLKHFPYTPRRNRGPTTKGSGGEGEATVVKKSCFEQNAWSRFALILFILHELG